MHLFAYGTLIDPEIMALVCGASYGFQKATLPGYVRKRVSGEVYPAIARQAGGSVDGIIYYNVSSVAFNRLDKFEGPLYARTQVVAVCGEDKPVTTHTYVITAGSAHRLSIEDWSYENFRQNHKQFFKR